MTPHLVKPHGHPGPLQLSELLALLGPDKLNAIDAKTKIMRETYNCPYTVRDYDAFKQALFEFFAHYQKTFYNADIKQSSNDEFWKHFAYDFVRQHLGSYHGGIRAAERNAVTGREGGVIAVIDALTEGILKFHLETYIKSVFFDRIAPSDYNTRMRLAEELLKKYGPVLYPGEQLLHPAFLAVDLEQFIQSFVNHLHGLRREWQY